MDYPKKFFEHYKMNKTKYFQNCLGVFQGGGCRASAYAGAYKEATNWGVSFSELVGTSAGAIIAVLISAGATPEQMESITDELDFKKLLSKPILLEGYTPPKCSNLLQRLPIDTIKKYAPVITALGLHNSLNIKVWIESKLSQILNKPSPVKFRDLNIPVHIIVSDLQLKKVEIFNKENSANMNVAEAVQYSCNIPLFFQPIQMRYVDGGMLSNLGTFVFAGHENRYYNKVLAFSLESNQQNSPISTIWDYGKSILNTIIDGNLDLQLSLQESVHIIRIPTGDVQATDFEKMTPEIVAVLKQNAEVSVRDFFENEMLNVKQNLKNPYILNDSFQTLNKITQLLEKRYDEIIILDDNNDWVYEIFPTLVKWVNDGTKILCIQKKRFNPDKHYNFRNRFLEHSGIKIITAEDIPFKGFIFDGSSREYCKAIVMNDNNHFHSKFYEGESDFYMISLARKPFVNDLNGIQTHKYGIEKIEDELLIKELRKVHQYRNPNVTIKIEDIEIEKLTFITRFVRAYKYRQITTLFNFFSQNHIGFFNSSRLILKDNKHTLITPPVVEKIGNGYYVIEGNTRLVYAHKNGLQNIKCIIIEGVQEFLPSEGRYKVQEVILSDKEVIGEGRYDNFDYTRFRKIESSVRDPNNCLL